MNRALPLEKLRGAVFAEPLSGQYDTLNSQIGRSQGSVGVTGNAHH